MSIVFQIRILEMYVCLISILIKAFFFLMILSEENFALLCLDDLEVC